MPAVVSWVKNILEDKEQWTGSRYFYLGMFPCSGDVETKAHQSLYAP